MTDKKEGVHPCSRCGSPMSGVGDVCKRHNYRMTSRVSEMGREVHALRRAIRAVMVGADRMPPFERALRDRGAWVP